MTAPGDGASGAQGEDGTARRNAGSAEEERIARYRELIADGELVHTAAHQIARDVGELVVGLAAARGLAPFVQAYASALGKALGEVTATALKRIDTLRYLLDDHLQAPNAAAVELHPDLPDEARLALLDLDPTAPDVRGKTLRWDPARAAWVVAERATASDTSMSVFVSFLFLLGTVVPASSGFAEGMGKGLGESTASGLRRFRLRPRRKNNSSPPPSDQEAALVTLEVDPAATGEALRALFDVDLAAPALAGRTLRWDEAARAWKPADDRSGTE